VGLICCEHPFDAGAAVISRALPGCDFAAQSFGFVDPAIQALTAQEAGLDLDHVEPTCVLGDVVEWNGSRRKIRLASAGGNA